MPQDTRYKKAEYTNQRDTAPYEAERAEWYRCSEGLTVGSRMTADGEILHISELDIDVPDPQNAGQLMKAESFRPLSLPEQERRFGRIMYMPYQPTDEELAQLGWERTGVTAEEVEADEQLLEQHSSDFEKELDTMGEPQLRHEAQYRFGLNFPAGMPARRMRSILMKHYKDFEGDPDFREEVTEQMMANAAQRVPSRAAGEAVQEPYQEIEQRQKDIESESKEEKSARRRAKADAKVKEAENNA